MASSPTIPPKISPSAQKKDDGRSSFAAVKPTDPASPQGKEEKPVSLYRPRTNPATNGASPFSRPATGGAATAASRTAASGFGQTSGERPSPFAPRRDPASPPPTQPASARFSAIRQQSAAPQKDGVRPRENATAALRSASPFRKDISISDEEFVLLRDFIYQQCGIFIAENRKYLVENRLSNRIKELNLKSYSEYYKFLRFDVNKKQELNKLFEMVTTNETSFFRNPPQLKTFQDVILADILDRCRKAGQRKLRIWSAGCSTGEEPYTLAIILHEVLKTEIRSWDIKITANDLSTAVLAAAQRGLYNEYALRTTPPEIIPKYFTKEGNVHKINPDVKRLVSFGQINLNDKEQLKKVEKSHIVFCRNVIIYFDDDMKRRVINGFYDNLLPNGVLLIGHSETLHNICRAFRLEHHTGTIAYRKQE